MNNTKGDKSGSDLVPIQDALVEVLAEIGKRNPNLPPIVVGKDGKGTA